MDPSLTLYIPFRLYRKVFNSDNFVIKNISIVVFDVKIIRQNVENWQQIKM